MKTRKILATILALAMSLSLVTPSFAAQEGSSTGTGEVEFVYNKNVFSVEIPVAANPDYHYNFILDPMDALKVSAPSAISAGADTNKLYFTNWTDADSDQTMDDGETKYSNKSDVRVVKNKSSFAVDLTLSVTLTGLGEEIKLSTAPATDWAASGTLENKASIYLAVDGHTMTGAELATKAEKTAKDEVPVATVGTAVTLTASLAAPASYTGGDSTTVYPYVLTTDPSKITTDNPKGYVYGVNSSYAEANNTAESYFAFWLTGKINTDADVDWSKCGELASTVKVVWNVKPDSSVTEGSYVDTHAPAAPVAAAPSIATTSYDMAAGTAIDITVDLGTGSLAATGLTSVTFLNYGGNTATGDFLSLCTFENNKLTIPGNIVDAILDQDVDSELTFTFNDDAATVVKVVLNNTSVTTEKDG